MVVGGVAGRDIVGTPVEGVAVVGPMVVGPMVVRPTLVGLPLVDTPVVGIRVGMCVGICVVWAGVVWAGVGNWVRAGVGELDCGASAGERVRRAGVGKKEGGVVLGAAIVGVCGVVRGVEPQIIWSVNAPGAP
jgi:hypothetical protein